jgi:hypothetical protein
MDKVIDLDIEKREVLRSDIRARVKIIAACLGLKGQHFSREDVWRAEEIGSQDSEESAGRRNCSGRWPWLYQGL